MPYCSLPDCDECQQQATSLIYAAPSTLYGTLAGGRVATQYDSTSPSDSSLYAGIYARKFGLSKKGLLQIDYSCSWNDLDRVMGRQY
ncbi:GH19660 [Drosophila grimshawi]|nr:GH19660 [Drosophila grimshawi]